MFLTKEVGLINAFSELLSSPITTRFMGEEGGSRVIEIETREMCLSKEKERAFEPSLGGKQPVPTTSEQQGQGVRGPAVHSRIRTSQLARRTQVRIPYT